MQLILLRLTTKPGSCSTVKSNLNNQAINKTDEPKIEVTEKINEKLVENNTEEKLLSDFFDLIKMLNAKGLIVEEYTYLTLLFDTLSEIKFENECNLIYKELINR